MYKLQASWSIYMDRVEVSLKQQLIYMCLCIAPSIMRWRKRGKHNRRSKKTKRLDAAAAAALFIVFRNRNNNGSKMYTLLLPLISWIKLQKPVQ